MVQNSSVNSLNGPPHDDRPCLVMVCNLLSPFWINLLRLLAAEIPELKVLTMVTHGPAEFRWVMDVPPEINVSYFVKHGEPANGGMLGAPWTDWKKGADLTRFIDAHRVAAVILMPFGYPSHLRLMRNLSKRGIPFFLRNDINIYVDEHRSPLRRWIKRQFYRWAKTRAAGVMPMGSLGEQYFLKYGMPQEKMYRVPWWPDFEWFAQHDADGVQAFRERFGLAADRRRLLYSGRLNPVKRVDLLLDAFAAIADERPAWDVVIAGAGPLEAELRARVPLALQSRVHWTGFLNPQELRNAYHACDALVLPSEREPWAVVVQEAMAAGLPVVASHVVGAAHDIVEQGVSGRIFTSGNLPELIDALREMTNLDKIDERKAAAVVRLGQWRDEENAVREVRRVLRDAGALPSIEPAATECRLMPN